MKKEIRTELDVCRANPEAAAFYVITAGKRENV